MPKGVLSLNVDGKLTYCTALKEQRGKGRCNHIAHQEAGQSAGEFLESIKDYMAIDDVIDSENISLEQTEFIKNILNENKLSFNENPDWENVIRNKIQNYFHIGKDDSYEEANLEKVEQKKFLNQNGDPVIGISLTYNFRGQEYNVDLGEIPEVQEDGTLRINGVDFRCLPVLSQYKSGVINFKDKTVVKQESGHLAMVIEKNSDNVKMRGQNVDIEEIQKYFNGEDNNLTDIQKQDLDNIDPIAFERFPNLKTNIKEFRDSQVPDEPSDISYRKVLTYEDQVSDVIDAQMRRMGVTFRTNLAKKQDNNIPLDDEKYPLFYQKNLTDNIKNDIVGRSNVQIADNLNPLAALSQSHKISLTGQGGYNRDKVPYGLRQVHPSHEGLIDNLDISAGKNLGLTMTLNGSDVDERGFIVKTDKKSSSVRDFIPFRKNTDLNRAGMAIAQMRQALPIVGGEDPKLLGDETSDRAWSSIRGAKLGSNLKVAYLPTEGTWEDAVVVSESCAAKFATRQNTDYKYTSSQIKNNEAVEIGREVKKGSEINGVKIKYDGVISEASQNGFKVESEFSANPGDKIANRYGSKGVISKVLPDSEMPKIRQADGTYTPAEILMSPNSVSGRINISQVMETNKGPINKKTNVSLPNGKIVQSTAGEQFFMRLNHISEKKLSSYETQRDSSREKIGLRIGEMESILLSDSQDKLKILDYLHNQEGSDARNKLNSLLKSVGVKLNISE